MAIGSIPTADVSEPRQKPILAKRAESRVPAPQVASLCRDTSVPDAYPWPRPGDGKIAPTRNSEMCETKKSIPNSPEAPITAQTARSDYDLCTPPEILVQREIVARARKRFMEVIVPAAQRVLAESGTRLIPRTSKRKCPRRHHPRVGWRKQN
jgi:hypothetical protein